MITALGELMQTVRSFTETLPLSVRIALGALFASTVGILAWWRRSLTPSGALGAALTGTALFGFAGWPGSFALLGFFLSSSLLSRLFPKQKASAEAEYAKGGTRDLAQALANGGVAALLAILYGLTGQRIWMGGLLGALAAANADTWATELGVLAPTPPRMITTGRPALPGTSGAISFAGTLASFIGAAFIGSLGAFAGGIPWDAMLSIACAGLAGSLADSLLGATLQASYYCPTCHKETERHLHRCGTPTVRQRGISWLGNDAVNLLATLTGALLGALLTA